MQSSVPVDIVREGEPHLPGPFLPSRDPDAFLIFSGHTPLFGTFSARADAHSLRFSGQLPPVHRGSPSIMSVSQAPNARDECTPPPSECAVAVSQSVSDLTKVSQFLVQADVGLDVSSQSDSDSDADQTSATQDMVDSLLSAIIQTLELKEEETASQDISVSFKRMKRPSRVFPNHKEFDNTTSRHWEHPGKRFPGRKRLDILYPFAADLVSKWSESPKVDIKASEKPLCFSNSLSSSTPSNEGSPYWDDEMDLEKRAPELLSFGILDLTIVPGPEPPPIWTPQPIGLASVVTTLSGLMLH
ncbi:unnamed protein product [Ranitomeya imitator]|uniref:Uncharacterized protein n=1 Tax=Ranitomeya imitator TaxID=111125 RepID=A0ABN9LBW7_9NEOB|nr:unnamed protein product [Ranitomeya imitator]